MDMDDAPQPVQEPANLKFLRRLVTVLTAVMIAGVLVIIALLVIRLSEDAPAPWPDEIALPEGTRAQAVTRGKGWLAVVTEDQRLLIFDAGTGALEQEIPITAGQ